MGINRRSFLRGRFRDSDGPVRLPWLKSPEIFNDRCTRCHRCAESCPEQIIISNNGGFPTIDFRLGECTFCGQCAQACPEDLFTTDHAQRPWRLIAVVDRTCLTYMGVSCRCCEDTCAVNAIRFTPRQGGVATPRLETERCTACGACVRVCPNGAIDVTHADGAPDAFRKGNRGTVSIDRVSDQR